MRGAFDPYAALNEIGIAAGHASIEDDSVHFTFFDERFTVPTVAILGLAKYNGYFYTAKIEDLREFAKRN